MDSFAIGDLYIDRVEESCGPAASPEEFMVGLPVDAVERNLDWLAPGFYDVPTRRAIMSVHTWIVRTRHFNVLIDGCYGNQKPRPGTPGNDLSCPWIERLAEKGLHPDAVDFVMCTHLHADHVGWNTRLAGGRWVPTFPNARYIFGRREYEYWSTASGPAATEWGQDGAFEDSVLPCVEAGLVQLADGGFTVDDDLVVEDAPGHTAGTVLIKASSRQSTGVFVGDILHMPLQILYPDVNSVVCLVPEEARTTRRRVLAECAERNHLLLPTHFPAPYCGRVTGHGGRFQFIPGR